MLCLVLFLSLLMHSPLGRVLPTTNIRFEVCPGCNLYYRVFHENIHQEKVLNNTLNTCKDYQRVELNIRTLTEKKAQVEEKKQSIQMKEMYQIQIMYLLHHFQKHLLVYRHQKGPNSETMMA